CFPAVELDPHYVRALLRRAELYEKTEKLDEALEDYKAVLEKDPSVHQAREACMVRFKPFSELWPNLFIIILVQLHISEPAMDSASEGKKKKPHVHHLQICKLKDLGNLVLRPFGLSTENFQIKQDSSTGSYSINFVQNPNNNR
ncbi:TTC1 protein, partial [Grantiella picta]|nr:TTC1 protein [Grantiella picta]